MRVRKAQGRLLVCPRPEYLSTPFEVSLQSEAFAHLGVLVYGEERPVIIEPDGTQWFDESLVGKQLVDFFLRHPTRYLEISEQRIADFSKVRLNVEECSRLLPRREKESVSRKLELLCDSYIMTLRYVVTTNLIVEDLYGKFESLLCEVLSPREVGTYTSALLRCPAAKRAAEMEFHEDSRGSKRILDVSSDPVVIFADPLPFTSYVFDEEVTSRVLKKGLPLAEFWSLRLIAPLAVQFAEDFRYADYSIRTHFKMVLRQTGECLGIQEQVYELGYRDVIERLR